MAVAIVANAVLATTTGTTTDTITIPTVSTGDLLVVLVSSRDHAAVTARVTCVDNDGGTWQQLGESTDRKATVFYRTATAATSAKTITLAGAVGSIAGGLTVYSGAGTPLDFTFQNNSAVVRTHPGFTPTNADSEVCFGVTQSQNDLQVTVLDAATLGTFEPENWQHTSTGGSDTGAVLSSRLSAGGPTATGDFTWTQSGAITNSLSFSIPPAGGGGGDPEGSLISGKLIRGGLLLHGVLTRS